MTDFNGSGTAPQIDVRKTATYRGLLAAVIIMGVLIVVGVGALVVGMVYKLGGRGTTHTESASYAPPPGAKLISMETSGDRLLLRLREGASEEVDIVDTTDGRLIARFRFSPADP